MKNAKIQIKELEKQVKIGDIVFIFADNFVFRKVAKDTQSWTNHVGIVIDQSEKGLIIAESKIFFSSTTTFTQFIARSESGRVGVKRMSIPFTHEQVSNIKSAALKRMGIFYDFGFNLYSRKQFCSRFVHEVVQEASQITLGKIETLQELFT